MLCSTASFPGHSYLQYLITCSMQIQRGKAWEIWLHGVSSGRRRVDTRGEVLWPPALGLIVQDEILCPAPPPPMSIFLSVTTDDQISQVFPLHICILQEIKYWNWERPGNEASLLHYFMWVQRSLFGRLAHHGSWALQKFLQFSRKCRW